MSFVASLIRLKKKVIFLSFDDLNRFLIWFEFRTRKKNASLDSCYTVYYKFDCIYNWIMDSFWLNCQRKVWSPRHVWNLIEYEMECVINVALSSYKCCRSRNNCLFNFVIFDGSINQQNLIPDDFLTSVFINTEFICDTI